MEEWGAGTEEGEAEEEEGGGKGERKLQKADYIRWIDIRRPICPIFDISVKV